MPRSFQKRIPLLLNGTEKQSDVSCNNTTSSTQSTNDNNSTTTVLNTNMPLVTNEHHTQEDPKENADNQRAFITLLLLQPKDISKEISATSASNIVDNTNTDATPIYDTDFIPVTTTALPAPTYLNEHATMPINNSKSSRTNDLNVEKSRNTKSNQRF